MSIRHTKEKDYIFTAQAYEAYVQINTQLLSSFWRSFEQNHFVDKGDIILYYMIEPWFLETGHYINVPISYDVDSIVQNLIDDIENTNLNQVFNKHTHVIYKGTMYESIYDLEYAEVIFAKYERGTDDSDYFGHWWWNMFDYVHEVIYNLVDFSE